MSLQIIPFVLGPLQNNSYLLVDPVSHDAAVVDPSFQCEEILNTIQRERLNLTHILLTHAHFDHLAGVNVIAGAVQPAPKIGLHPEDLPLWQSGGGAADFGLSLDPGPRPALFFSHGQQLTIGDQPIEIRHTPGHTRGHVVFYLPQNQAVLCGDLIFWHSVGRTDLPGGSAVALYNSIHTHILNLPPNTRLLSGHGPETTVAEEAANNPFL